MFAVGRLRALVVLVALPVVISGCERGSSLTGPSVQPVVGSAPAALGFGGTGSGITARAAHVAARLPDGRVLIAGGFASNLGLKSAELYDPATGTWSAAAGLSLQRFGHAATTLADGRVLVVGGVPFLSACADAPTGTSTEIYDPATGGWTSSGSMTQGRASPLAVTLADGRVLVAGGGSRCGAVYATAELYDPATGRWSPTGAMNVARQSPAAVRLPDGRVLVAGGAGPSPFPSLASAEIYDPASGVWTPTGSMHDARMWEYEDMSPAGALALLPDGRVFTAGGLSRCNNSGNCDVALRSAELYDPASGAWAATGSLTDARWRHTTSVLTDGRVLVAGGRVGFAILASAETFDPATGTFSPAGNLVTGRYDYTATRLTDGRVLLVDGNGPTGVLKSSELFTSNRPPVANAGPATVAANEGAAVSFDGSASFDPDGSALTYLWSFGDGTPTAAGATVSHVFADNGTYTVTLTVSDGDLNSSTTVAATIANVAPTVSDLGAGAVAVGETYTRSGSFTDPGADSWTATVDYGDGSGAQPLALSGTQFTLSHVYKTKGSFAVTVIVTDDDGGSGSAQAAVAVANRAPVANAGAATVAANEGATLVFDGSASSDPDGDPLSYSWDFGDGTAPASGATVSHTFADNGTYPVTLTVSDGSLTGTATVSALIANVAPVVTDLSGATLAVGEPYAASGSFADPGADHWTATVNYGDGSGAQPLALSGMTFSLNHVYAAAGTFLVTVTVTDDDGGAGSAVGQVVVQNGAPVANAGPAASGVEGSAVTFDGRGSTDPDGNALSYSWSFGDGSAPASGATVSHAYADNGTYTVTLTVSDGSLSASATTTAAIANVAPAVSAPAPASLLPGDAYSGGGSFTDPGADAWTATVDYGDGAGPQPLPLSGMTYSLSHVYMTGGTYTLTVRVGDDDGGVGTASATISVQTAQQAIAQVEGLIATMQSTGVLEPPTANSLAASLDAAIAKLDAGDTSGAINDLQVFIKKVEGLVKTGRLTAEEARPLLDAARRILASLGVT